MDENWDEEEDLEPASNFKLPQFSPRTLMTVLIGAAIFFSLVVWWGLYPVVFILSSALGIFLGLLLCSYVGLGFTFDNLPYDIAKCLLVACATFAPIYLLPLMHIPILSTTLYPFAPVFFYWLGMKVAWNELEAPELFLTAIISFFTWATLTYVTSLIFGV
jgi:hypothetical protein